MNISPREQINLTEIKPATLLTPHGDLVLVSRLQQFTDAYHLTENKRTPLSEEEWDHIDLFFAKNPTVNRLRKEKRSWIGDVFNNVALSFSAFNINGISYISLGKIGEGAFGRSRLLINRQGELIVIKSLRRRLKQTKEDFQADVENEIEINRLLNELVADFQPSFLIPKEPADEKLHIVLKAIDGISANQLCRTVLNSPISSDNKFNLIIPILLNMIKEITHIHANNILHRDIKPVNFLATLDKTKIIDFGLAGKTDDIVSGFISTSPAHTRMFSPPEYWAHTPVIHTHTKAWIKIITEITTLFESLKPVRSALHTDTILADSKKLAASQEPCYPVTQARDIFCLGLSIFDLYLRLKKDDKLSVTNSLFLAAVYDIAAKMVRYNAKERPSAKEVVADFEKIPETIRPLVDLMDFIKGKIDLFKQNQAAISKQAPPSSTLHFYALDGRIKAYDLAIMSLNRFMQVFIKDNISLEEKIGDKANLMIEELNRIVTKEGWSIFEDIQTIITKTQKSVNAFYQKGDDSCALNQEVEHCEPTVSKVKIS